MRRWMMATAESREQVVPFEEVVLAQTFEFGALLNVLERRGLLKRSEGRETVPRWALWPVQGKRARVWR